MDKTIFWALSKTSENFRQIILMGYSIASLVIVEDIETQRHKGTHRRAGKIWVRDVCCQQFIQTCRNRNGMETDAQRKTPGTTSPYTKR